MKPAASTASAAVPHRPSTPAELFAAYRTASGFPIVMSHAQERELREICRVRIETIAPDEKPWFTPADVAAVVDFIKAAMRNPQSGYTRTSLSPRKIFEFTQFQFLALDCRHRARLRRPKAAREVSQTDALGTTRLLPEAAPEPLPVSAVISQGFKDLKAQLRGYTGSEQ